LKGNPNHDGRTSVPILWDKKIEQIVNNERPDIIKMINSQFNYLSKLNYTDIYPKELQKEIDESQEWILPKI
jgi:putative glutathione S-transferase